MHPALVEDPSVGRKLRLLHKKLDACTACPDVVGPVVHGAPVLTDVFLLGQAPGPHEGDHGRPFAWTAGKTMFKWFEDAMGASEEQIRACVYFAAVARCFPGKAKGGGDRVPSAEEIEACGAFLKREVAILRPRLIVPVGQLAIGAVLGGEKRLLVDVIGAATRATFHGVTADVIALPHPSGASTWHRVEPGKTLLAKALQLLAAHPVMREALRRSPGRGALVSETG
ncbi:MAG: uracil-DNA glycosylase family protein [Polyangiaceae bacterium]